jgi:hypothetical protein
MHRRLAPPLAVLAALALAFAWFLARAVAPVIAQQVLAQGVAGTEAVRIKGDAKALELDVHQATLAQVLTALGPLNIHYRSPVALNDPIDGTYTGPLNRVLARLLAGYNYAVKQGDPNIEVIIVSRHGEQAPPGPSVVPVRRRD